jgi:hypothetical protein
MDDSAGKRKPKSLLKRLGPWPFDREDDETTLEHLRKWSADVLEHFLEGRLRELWKTRERFPNAEADIPFHQQTRKIRSLKRIIRLIEEVRDERQAVPPESARSEAGHGELPAAKSPVPPVAAAKSRKQAKEPRGQRARRRQSIMDPILEALGWSAYRWAKQAGVSLNAVLYYLNGGTHRLRADTRCQLEKPIRHHLAGTASKAFRLPD